MALSLVSTNTDFPAERRRPNTPTFTKYTKSLAWDGRQPYPLVNCFEFAAFMVNHQSKLRAPFTWLS
jgi:hypothetical protein